MVREDLVHSSSEGVGARHPVVEALADLARRGGGQAAHVRSQKEGPTGSEKSPLATKYPSSSTLIASWGRGRAAGPKIGRAPSDTSKTDWWHGQSRWCVCCS